MADTIQRAKPIMELATRQIKALEIKGRQFGAKARADSLTPEQGKEIAKKAAQARWG